MAAHRAPGRHSCRERAAPGRGRRGQRLRARQPRPGVADLRAGHRRAVRGDDRPHQRGPRPGRAPSLCLTAGHTPGSRGGRQRRRRTRPLHRGRHDGPRSLDGGEHPGPPRGFSPRPGKYGGGHPLRPATAQRSKGAVPHLARDDRHRRRPLAPAADRPPDALRRGVAPRRTRPGGTDLPGARAPPDLHRRRPTRPARGNVDTRRRPTGLPARRRTRPRLPAAARRPGRPGTGQARVRRRLARTHRRPLPAHRYVRHRRPAATGPARTT